MRVLIWIAGLCFMLSLSAPAQTPAASQSPPLSTPSTTLSASSTDTGPVAVPEPSEKAMSYYRSGIVLWIVTTLWGFLIPALFLFTGFSARIRDWAQRITKQWVLVIALYFIIFTLISFVIELPLDYYQDFARPHAYDLSNQTFGKWFGDAIKTALISLTFGALTLWIPYLLLKKSPQRWWLYTGLLAIPFIVLTIMLQPVFIDPLFNQFGPMKDKALETKILQLATRAGIEGGRVYEVDKSADTKAIDAYVNGFGSTKRIVLWDTAIAKLNEQELLFVMGHEMGHYVLGHVWKAICFFAVLILATLYAIHRTAGWLINKYQHRFGFNQLSNIASFPLIILLFGLYLFIVTPMVLAFTRHNEHEADRFGLEITQNNHAAATAFVKLQTENLANPRPDALIKFWRASHPTLGERIDFCNEYRPWEQGQSLEYSHLFRNAK